ncbi:hypothetical protein CBQ26_00420 [Deinococcus indicus]|uniref:Uncharacterized protein n=1 Tax=Deinococcus indicus TaxID=223556 RepID=A0A246BTD5_9DEIO|nr:hypothetical protein [Deinococcus indicus]OWL98956.1 hypothetical protein CBQ26_00420 [Deinococcus indicus]
MNQPTVTPLGTNLQLRALPLAGTGHLYVHLPELSGTEPFSPVNVQALAVLTPEQVAAFDPHDPRRQRDTVEILRPTPRGLTLVAYARPAQRPARPLGDLEEAVTLLTSLQGLLQTGNGPSEGARFQHAGPLYARLPAHLDADLSDAPADYRVRPLGDQGNGAPCWLIGGVEISGAGQVRWQIELPGPAVDG